MSEVKTTEQPQAKAQAEQPPKPGGGLIKSIKELRHQVRTKMLLYGRSGTGKTNSAACSSTNGGADTLFLITETQGLATLRRNLSDAPNIITIHTLDEFRQVQGMLLRELSLGNGRLPWECIVLDTLDDYQRLLKMELSTRKGSDKLTQNDWGVIVDSTEVAMRFLRDLPVSLLVIAHTAEREDQEGNKSVTPAFIGKQTYERVASMCNLVFVQRKFAVEGGGTRYGIVTEGGDAMMTKTMPKLPSVIWPEEALWKRLFHQDWKPPVEAKPEQCANEQGSAQTTGADSATQEQPKK